MSYIEVTNLRKSFPVSQRSPGFKGALAGLFTRARRRVHALNGVSFALDEGELVGYIGPNGAGKSTTVKIMAGILLPDSGGCTVGGRIPWKNRIEHVRRIGVVFGQRTQLWWDLPVEESFLLLKDIYDIGEEDYQLALEELVDMLDLAPLLPIPVRQLSLGQRMRCDIAAALLHSPDILFLDEPTIGLDAIAKLAVRDIIRRINRDRNTTMILTTHDMDDIEALCSRVIVIGNGEILYNGSLSELRRREGDSKILTVDFHIAPAESDLRLPAQAGLISLNKKRGVFRISSGAAAGPVITELTAGHGIRDLTVENPPVEELIADLYKRMGSRSNRTGSAGDA